MSKELSLSEYRPESELVQERHILTRAKYPAVNSHVHFCSHNTPEKLAALVEKMDAGNIRAIVDLPFDEEMPVADLIRLRGERYPGRFLTLATLPWQREFTQGGDIGARLAKLISKYVGEGAAGLKIYKYIGLVHRDGDGKLVMPDDPRISDVFDMCGELKVPCLFHIADPVAFFKPLTATNERYEELSENPEWHVYGKDYPSFEKLMDCQERLLERHRKTTFIIPHVAGCGENLALASRMIDRHPNLYVDTSARLAELGRQPYTSRKFFLRHADRILFGTDDVRRMRTDQVYMRFFETFDEYFPYSLNHIPDQGRWDVYGIGLPDEVLRKVYFENAEKVYPQLKSAK